MYPAATIASPHWRSSRADAGRGKGVVIQGLKGGEPRFVAPRASCRMAAQRLAKVGRPLTGVLLMEECLRVESKGTAKPPLNTLLHQAQSVPYDISTSPHLSFRQYQSRPRDLQR